MVAETLEQGAECFSLHNMSGGIDCLQTALQTVVALHPNTPLQQVAARTDEALGSWGADRIDLILLAMHALDLAWHQDDPPLEHAAL